MDPGDPSGEATPVPIPNTEVKLSSAEDTQGVAPRENRPSPGFFAFFRREALAGSARSSRRTAQVANSGALCFGRASCPLGPAARWHRSLHGFLSDPPDGRPGSGEFWGRPRREGSARGGRGHDVAGQHRCGRRRQGVPVSRGCGGAVASLGASPQSPVSRSVTRGVDPKHDPKARLPLRVSRHLRGL